MTDAVASLLVGAVLGLSLAAPPGPMNAIIAEQSVRRGWHSGFAAGLGAMTADACFFLLALGGALTVVREAPSLRALMLGVGGALMLYFAYGTARAAGTTFTDGAAVDTGFRRAFALAITNPYQVLWWLTVGVTLLAPGRIDVLGQAPYVGDALTGAVVVQTGSAALIVGFFGGVALWIVGFPAALVTAGRRTDAFATAVAYGSAAVLAGFGAFFLVDAANAAGVL